MNTITTKTSVLLFGSDSQDSFWTLLNQFDLMARLRWYSTSRIRTDQPLRVVWFSSAFFTFSLVHSRKLAQALILLNSLNSSSRSTKTTAEPKPLLPNSPPRVYVLWCALALLSAMLTYWAVFTSSRADQFLEKKNEDGE